MNPLCTVVVGSCDKYADLLDPFIKLFRKFWSDCPFEVVLVTESKPHVEGFDRIIACGNGMNWASRMEKALESISSSTVLMLCDDYYLSSTVDTQKFLLRLEQMISLKAVNMRLIPNPALTGSNSRPVADVDLFEYRKNTAYCIATQAGIWDRNFLKGLLHGKSSIWEFERQGSFMVADEKRPLLVTPTKEFPFLDAVHKGYWEKFGVKCLAENGIEFDFSKRSLPPLSVWLVERLKAFVFAVVPNTLIVRIQNFFDLGAKEKTLLSHSRELNIARS